MAGLGAYRAGNMKKIIDLHLHSTVSDGSLPPEELMEVAAKAGVRIVSLTDHDSTAGLARAAAAAGALGMEFIPGVELGCSTEYGQVDVLGYYAPMNDARLEKKLRELRAARDRRNLLILEKLAALGLPVSPAELSAKVESAAGRPHMAAIMLKKGYVKSIREAFDRFLGENKPAYVPKEDFYPEEAVDLLAAVGAVPVIAHPMLIRAPWEWLDSLAGQLAGHGLAGLEAYHSEHDGRGVRKIVGLAQKYGLIVTGGSDFHGAAKPYICVGRGRGSLRVPETVPRDLEAARAVAARRAV